MTNELYHYGIKGMKWGVRRYENEDGTLTEAGKKRYHHDYSDHQRKQDERLYGKHAPKRIQKKLDKGETLLSARNAEVKRRNKLNKIKRNLKLAAATATPIALASAYALYQNKQFNKSEKEFQANVEKGRQALYRVQQMRDENRKKLDEQTKEIMDRLNKVLGSTPKQTRQTKDPNRDKGNASDSIKKLFEDANKRDQKDRSDFEKKMKEYWEKKGRDDWNKRNRRN